VDFKLVFHSAHGILSVWCDEGGLARLVAVERVARRAAFADEVVLLVVF
jgi:hypothetical protein